MAEYDNTNSGVLFKNDKKESEKHPDYTGKVNMGGKEMRLAAWIKQGQKGKFMSLSLSEFQVKEDAPKTIAEQKKEGSFNDDDLPF